MRDGAAMTQPPFHRSALEHRSLDRLEAVDAGGQECLNRGRHGVCSRLGIVGEHREHLLDEEWVAFGRADDALPERRRDGFVVNQPRMSCSESALVRGESETSVVRGRGADQDGRASKRSGRARQRSRIAAPPEKPRTYSSRSSNAGSAQWMSSTTTTRGRGAAMVSKSCRNAQAVSSGEPCSSFRPIAPAISLAAIGPRSTLLMISISAGSGSAPATSCTTSKSGRYVMPSP